MEDLKTNIAAHLQALRLEAGLTQLELAEKLNYSDKAISKWERAEAMPDITVLKSLAELYGVSLDFLVSDPNSPPPERAQENRAAHDLRRKNRVTVTLLSVMGVWLAATLLFVILDLTGSFRAPWLVLVYALPASLTVWLVLSCLWFERQKKFFIISLLIWSLLAAIFFTGLSLGKVWWQLFLIGIPAQLLTLVWPNLKYKR